LTRIIASQPGVAFPFCLPRRSRRTRRMNFFHKLMFFSVFLRALRVLRGSTRLVATYGPWRDTVTLPLRLRAPRQIAQTRSSHTASRQARCPPDKLTPDTSSSQLRPDVHSKQSGLMPDLLPLLERQPDDAHDLAIMERTEDNVLRSRLRTQPCLPPRQRQRRPLGHRGSKRLRMSRIGLKHEPPILRRPRRPQPLDHHTRLTIHRYLIRPLCPRAPGATCSV
jgi:hypothetical protein